MQTLTKVSDICKKMLKYQPLQRSFFHKQKEESIIIDSSLLFSL